MADAITRWTKYEHLPEYLTVEELAIYLDTSRNGAYNLVRSQAIESRRFGKLIRIPRVALAQDAGKNA